jgi:peptide/nickel transport system ATP-binding protein
VREIVAEPIRPHGLIRDERALRRRVGELLTDVGLAPRDGEKYPHEFSGGQRQRISIARALSSNPEFLVCDEPTSALDVSVQAQIITLIKRLGREHGTAVMLVTHDMGVIAETADRVAVMYAGRIVEIGPVQAVIHDPQHPYTAGLMGSIPTVGQDTERLPQIEGSMPRLDAIPAGCAFNPRCPRAFDRCRAERPGLLEAHGTLAACWLHAPERAALGARPGWSEGAVHG